MKTCPHCGAELRETARFCPACMTSLIEKRVIRTPKYALQRWLPVAAAVFVRLAAVGAVWTLHGQQPVPRPDLSAGPSGTTDGELSPTEEGADGSTPVSTGTRDRFDTTTAPVAGPRPGNIFVPFPVTSKQPPTTATSRTRTPYIPTTTRSTTTTIITKQTVKTSTTKQTTTTTKPYWIDGTPSLFTEDGLPIEEVTWHYKPITQSSFSQFTHNIHQMVTIRTSAAGTPLTECIQVTGFDGSASNGIYRIPATIDGKPVAIVDFGDSSSDPTLAATVKRIYLPPEVVYLKGDLTGCTNLKDLWFFSKSCYFHSNILPEGTESWYGGVKFYPLTIHAQAGFKPTYYYTSESIYTLVSACGDVYKANHSYFSPYDPTILAMYGGGES